MKHYHQRLKSGIYSILILSIASMLILSVFWEELHLYVTPVMLMDMSPQTVQLGGIVKPGSLKREQSGGRFSIIDKDALISVQYRGGLPTMVRESHEVLVMGYWNGQMLQAKKVYAKHDEYYREQ
ncbi:cytochrome c maturation protein CcmE [Gammaproteobacteria bacterium]|nr:cytochrome c maturation protein CcmE [Gammaproteobacteria bacterium]